MKHTALISILTTSLLAPSAFAANVDLKTANQKASYALGIDLAKSFEKQGLEVDSKALMLGLTDVMNKEKIRLTPEEMQQAVETVKQNLIKKQMEARKALGEKNAKAGQAFLEQNKNKPGVKVTKSGLQYVVLKAGKGAPPTDSDYITANYEGTDIDGKVFDSSYQRGTPIEIQMHDVIAGWGEALKMMKPGSKWKIFVPPSLGYGSKGAGKVIGPNQTLIFTIEMITYSKDKPSH
ncbi:FKBP-type peptidyl-prolyl cis-trans isomerase [Hydrogenovibrio marinus]|uniref:Peptidyl-prolyl cis-trans isomerase n=1 Tax=Hydrogenovibrio marinus TaxID=28885 RepID=A0A066ZMT6_HYDMR|nr:FKBP-type peptidyl-prolyl cis-trans isomerase [Hydrogenovibrio marinus]KDN94812.1 membrane protein [Hydrogenovibrio marinus]BBN59270.1 peptidyl-prolyl cis-trans isomerase Mip [Hydrogenovibrio marinus]